MGNQKQRIPVPAADFVFESNDFMEWHDGRGMLEVMMKCVEFVNRPLKGLLQELNIQAMNVPLYLENVAMPFIFNVWRHG